MTDPTDATGGATEWVARSASSASVAQSQGGRPQEGDQVTGRAVSTVATPADGSGWRSWYPTSPDTPVAPRRNLGYGPTHATSPDATIYMGMHAIRPEVLPPLPDDVRGATMAHALPLISHWIGPLIVYLTAGRRSSHVRTEAAHSLNWELTVAIALALCGLLAPFGVIAPALAIGVAVLSLGLHIAGAITAARGHSFAYPFAIPFVR